MIGMLLSAVLAGCADPPPPVAPPETHSWKHEGELVVAGLEDVKRMWRAGQREAARTLAERVYTERWEPRLEPALRTAKGDVEAARAEYSFGLLLAELEGNGARALERIAQLEELARAVATEAAREWPTTDGTAPPPPAADGSKPVVPDVRPAWEE